MNDTAYDRQFSEWMVNTWAPQFDNVYVYDVFEYMTCGSENSVYSAYTVSDNHPTPLAGEILVKGGTNACGESVQPFGEFLGQVLMD